MRQTRAIELGTGLFVLLGFAALFFLITQITSREFGFGDGGYRLTATFEQVGGLKPGAPVSMSGVTVGRVTSITIDVQTYQGVVTLAVDRELQFPRDTSAKILTAGLLGDQYIGLEPGADEKELADRDVIKQTQSAVVLENLIGQLIFNRAADAGSANPAPAETAPKK